MHQFVLALASFTCFLTVNIFALFQDAGLAPYKDVGMSAAFIGTCVFMFRYFTNVIETKEAREKELIQLFLRFIAEHLSTKQHHTSTEAKELLQRLEDIHLSK